MTRVLLYTRKVGVELLLVALVAVSYMHVYQYHAENTPGARLFGKYMLQFYAPAIFLAGGHGLSMGDVGTLPELEWFLSGESDAFDVGVLDDAIETAPLEPGYEYSFLYGIYALGLFWRLFNVSIQSYVLFTMLLAIVSGTLIYFLFRLFLRPVLSAIGAFLVISAPPVMVTSWLVRDLTKMPFIFGIVLASAILAKYNLTKRGVMLFTAALGLWLGIGFGFREDVLAYLPMILVLFPLATIQSCRNQLAMKAAMMAMLVIVFFVASYPVSRNMTDDHVGQIGFTFIQGVSTEIEHNMDFGDSAYEILNDFDDPRVFAVINAHARRSGSHACMANPNYAAHKRMRGNHTVPLTIPFVSYTTGQVFGHAANQLMYDIMLMFPADIVVRALWAIPQTIRKAWDVALMSSNHEPAFIALHARCQRYIGRHLYRHGVLYVLIALLIAVFLNVKTGLMAAIAVVWMCSYPSLLFDHRHFSHMIFLPILSALLIVSCLYSAVRNRQPGLGEAALRIKTLFRNIKPVYCVAVLALAVLGMAGIAGLYAWQYKQVVAYTETLYALPTEEIAVTEHQEDGRVHLRPAETLPGLKNASQLPSGETAWDYVALRFDTYGDDIDIMIEYDKTRTIHDFSQEVTLHGIQDESAGAVTYYFPIYETNAILSPATAQEARRMDGLLSLFYNFDYGYEAAIHWERGKFMGISLNEGDRDKFRGMYHVTNHDALPLLLHFQLPGQRDQLRYYKRMIRP